MQDQVKKAKAKGLVLGLSGGIDSAVVAALSKMACGDNVLAMIMPCHSNPESAEHAVLVAGKLGIRKQVTDLTAAYDALVPHIPRAGGIELVNVRPRLRMTALYCAAQALNYLVVGTGNKTEIAIGYFTKWGDGAADIKPIANLYKHQVVGLALELGIPEEIIAKPPTADLWEGQTDENEIGMSYDELDRILQGIETGELATLDARNVEQVRKMIALSEHKRAPVPAFEFS
ncbi:MAG: NAD(+) synthase [Armatimonadetes bacterium RBG_16_58_9]|nr:MAG: NAD(+) synthase [Armatimonadetes bacterium RBG_16_58_9]